jgi:hypothetical protein
VAESCGQFGSPEKVECPLPEPITGRLVKIKTKDTSMLVTVMINRSHELCGEM